MLETMHLTKITQACTALTAQGETNATHPEVLRLLSRIVIYIAYDKWTQGA
jgi:hypothetical protein